MGQAFMIPGIGEIQIYKLSKEYCTIHSDELLEIINEIPYIKWSDKELLSQNEDFYSCKWNYSYVAMCSGEIIAVLIAYFRIADEKHIFDSLYIHKFAVKKNYQNKGIGTFVLNYFIQKSYKEIPWLLNISVQTNNNKKNMPVIQFYKNIGFNKMYNITYPDKEDVLFLLERRLYNLQSRDVIKIDEINLRHPHYNVCIDIYKPQNVLPVVYFSTTNEKKKEIVKFIFNNYNIEVNFVKSPIELNEPQVESADLKEEQKLVSLPLKYISRFINKVPYIIEDTMMFVEFFNRNGEMWELPGLDTKRWLRQLGLDGLLDIMGNTKKRKAKFVSQTGAFVNSNNYVYGRGEVYGSIAYKKANIIKKKYGTYPYFFHLLFIPDGADKTLSEMDMFEYAKYDYMRKSIVQLINELAKGDPYQRQYTIFDYLQERI